MAVSIAADQASEHLLKGARLPVFVEGLVLVVHAVVVLVVDVDKGALDIGQAFELALQRLADIVRIAQADLRVHDDVDFDVETLTGVVGAALGMGLAESSLRLGRIRRTVSTLLMRGSWVMVT